MELGQGVGLGRGEANVRTASLIAARELERAKVTDLTNRIAAVFLPHVLDHLAPPLETEVDIDVGHRDAFRIQESLNRRSNRGDRRW